MELNLTSWSVLVTAIIPNTNLTMFEKAGNVASLIDMLLAVVLYEKYATWLPDVE